MASPEELNAGGGQPGTRPVSSSDQDQSMVKRHFPRPVRPAVDALQSSRSLLRQLIQAREEIKHLQTELAEQQAELARVVAEYSAQQSHFDQEVQQIKQEHQSQIEQYQSYLRDMLDENRQLQAARRQAEERYQELQQSYQNAVEEEAHKMIAEVANTIILRPDHLPSIFNDVKKTIELQLRQEEDQQAAATLYLIRDAQRRAHQLEEELAREREQIANERQSLLAMQNSIREQAELRYKTLAARLHGRWALALTLSALTLLVPLPLLQSLFFFVFHLSPVVSFYVPVAICLLFIGIFARFRTAVATYYESAPRKSRSSKAT
jgi:hypothetical protein